jgi:RNA ligase
VRDWPGARTRHFEASSLSAALELPPRPNAEGVVVRFLDTDLLVKIKQDDYVALHRLVTGLSERSVWEHLAAHGGTYDELLAAIPDEFHGWVQERATALIQHHNRIARDARNAHYQLLGADPWADPPTRKEYALAVRDRFPALAPYCFQLLDGRDPSPAIWKSLRPVGFTPMRHTSEDVA